MYESYFGLKKNPFSTAADPSVLFLTNAHREALAGLSYAVMLRKGFVLLSGEAGTGKTTLLRKLLKIVPEAAEHSSVIFNPTLTPSEFFELMLANFGIRECPQSKAQRLMLLERLLVDVHRQGHTSVLIIDEAHKLSTDVLEEIRLLTNFETSDQKLIQIILAGHPELTDVLNKGELWQLKQRIAVRVQIGALTSAETQQYIAYRWNKAVDNTHAVPFAVEAINAIAVLSKGIPRLINVICDNALILAFVAGARSVEACHVRDASAELDLRLSDADLAVSSNVKQRPAPAPLVIPAVVPAHGAATMATPPETLGDKPVLVKAAAAVAGATAVTPAHEVEEAHMEPLSLSMIERYMPEKRGFFRGGWLLRRKA